MLRDSLQGFVYGKYGTYMVFQVSSSSFLAARTSAVQYLEAQLPSVTSDAYALSLVTYALTLANSEQANTALQRLNALATTEGLSSTFTSFLNYYHHFCLSVTVKLVL